MDIQQTVQFILDHQAAHATAIARHDEILKNQQQVLLETQQVVRQHGLMMDALIAAASSNTTAIQDLVGVTEQVMRGIGSLREDVDVLVKVVDELIRRPNQ